jgi:SAM-dependent methyltransferase
MKDYKAFASFITEDGQSILLYEGMRNETKPNWQSFFEPTLPRESLLYTDMEQIKIRKKSVEVAADVLQHYGFTLKDKEILEIGCYEGLQSHVIACGGAKSVVGLDVNEYGVRQSMNMDADMNRYWINRMRKMTQAQFPDFISEKVSFVEGDATKMEYENAFDLIFSFDTLEHLIPPEKAFQNMYRALRKGGAMFHSYNPFFSLNGGHSPCTLDFMWGHCSISEKDVERYIKLLRPQEAKTAIPFFYESLNRMTFSDMKNYYQNCGFKLIYIKKTSNFFYGKEESARESIIKEFLPFINKHYPSAEADDLLYDNINVIMLKE